MNVVPIIQKEFLAGWPMLDPTICDGLRGYFEGSDKKFRGIVHNEQGVQTDPNAKMSTEVVLPRESDLAKRYFVELQLITDLYVARFPWCNKFAPWAVTDIVKIKHFKPGEAYHQIHCERGGAVQPIGSRHLVFMTYMNDVTDGGETEFVHQQIKVRPQKGLTLIWPADWTYVHRGIVSATQDKFIVGGWYNFTR